MNKNTHKFYVTTPIYYVTAKPHLGSLYSTLLADVAARWHKLQGKKVFFLTGTDEHGQKIAQAAEKAGKQPKEFVDSFIDAFKETWRSYAIDYSCFIRTTDTYHVKAVQQWLLELMDKGDIYKAVYAGWYCTPCETFLTEKDTENKQNGVPLCPSCSRPTHFIEEETYFFKLSAYQDKLLKFYADHPDFITPAERLNEVINFVKEGLRDLSISRTTITWGIPFPHDAKHVTYVWADALNNYITAIGYGDTQRQQEFNFWWPADLQIMGKDIVRFHAIYWPAFLMASDLALPHRLLVHGWIKVGEQKMSKSLGNVVDPQFLQQTYGADQIRYYLTRYMAINQDSPFSIEDLEQKINADLANDLGNLLNRMLTLAHNYDITQLKPAATWQQAELNLHNEFLATINQMKLEMDNYYFHRAYAHLWKFISQSNAYFHAQEPWKVAKADPQRFAAILSATAHSLYSTAILLWPVAPTKVIQLLDALGVSLDSERNYLELLQNEPWQKTFTLQQIPPLFKKIEPKKEPMIEDIKPAPISNTIPFDDFAKVELVVGTIDAIEEVPKSDKLYKLTVNFGDKGTRTICSGVRQHFAKEDLLNKQGIFVFNLAPRAIMGIESQGMMLFAEDAAGKLQLVTVGAPVPNGTKLR